MTSELSFTQSCITKTSTQFTAENSFQGTGSNVIMIACMHFVGMDEEDFDVRRELKEVLLKTRLLYDLITDSQDGVPVVLDKSE